MCISSNEFVFIYKYCYLEAERLNIGANLDNVMRVRQFQLDVEGWVSGYEVKYFPPLEILANIQEEKDEVFDELYADSVNPTALTKELVDLLFSTFCMANYHDHILTNYASVKPLDIHSPEYLRQAVKLVNKATLQLYGSKPLKPNDESLDLKIQLCHVVNAAELVADTYNMDLNYSWEQRFSERTSRDNARFEKNKK